MARKPSYEELERKITELEMEAVERKRADEAVRESQERYRDLYENAPNAYFSVSAADGSILILGYDRDTVVGTKVVDLYADTPHGRPKAQEVFNRFKDGLEHSAEVHENHLGGDFLVPVSPPRNVDGTLIGSVHVARDITERRQMEEALRKSRDELERRVEERTAD